MEFAKHQDKTLEIRRGLFLIRYHSADDDKNPPRVLVASEGDSGNGVEIILPPDADEAILWSPGSSLVVRANQPGQVQITVAQLDPEGSLAASLQLVPLLTDPNGMAARDTVLDLAGFKVLGHVAGVGDVSVSSGEWIAGPTKPARIEGFAIEWPEKPKDLNLRYAVRIAGQPSAGNVMFDAGGFAGTRGRATPLIGFTMEITGSASTGLQITADAIFLGSPQMRVAGKRIVLSGPTGREALVGLRIKIERLDQVESQDLVSKSDLRQSVGTEPSLIGATADSPELINRKVRVFRSTKQ
jgi:hypothetical protein